MTVAHKSQPAVAVTPAGKERNRIGAIAERLNPANKKALNDYITTLINKESPTEIKGLVVKFMIGHYPNVGKRAFGLIAPDAAAQAEWRMAIKQVDPEAVLPSFHPASTKLPLPEPRRS